jgi:hypothetical protein
MAKFLTVSEAPDMTKTPSYAVLVCGLLLCANVVAAEKWPDKNLIVAELQRTAIAPDSQTTVSIAAPVEFVFDFLSRRPHDYTENAVSVAFDHSDAEIAGLLGSGSDRMITMEDGETLVQRFLLFDAPTTYAYLTDMQRSTFSAPLNYSITRYELFAREDGGTTLQVALAYEPSSRWLAFLVKRAFNSAIQDDFERAAEAIAAAWAATGSDQ